MPRRTGPEAERAAAQAIEARWRYLLRHPTFRADLHDVLTTRSRWPAPHIPSPEGRRKFWDLQKKWQFSGMSSRSLHDAPDLTSQNMERFEALYDPEESYEPVSVIYDEDGDTYLDAHMLGDRRKLFLEVDLRYPRDVLIALIDEQLRKTLGERKVTPRDGQKKRSRLDKVDSYLKVYDLAEAGETFTQISRTVSKPVSSVKSVYLAARRNIFVEIPAGAGIPPTEAPSKRHAPRAEFDDARNIEDHVSKCAVCRKAERFEDMCPQARAFVDQDSASQRELAVGRDPLRLSEQDILDEEDE